MADAKRSRWLWLALAILLADLGSKSIIERATPEAYHRAIVSGYVFLVHTHNPGIAFGLFADHAARWVSVLLTVLSLAVAALLAWLLLTGRAGGRIAQAGIALILGGACGNLLDRLWHGGVTDFFEVRLGSFRWPAFNVADSAITIGAVLVVFELLFRRHEAT